MFLALLIAHLAHIRFESDSDEETQVAVTELIPEPQPDFMSESLGTPVIEVVNFDKPPEEPQPDLTSESLGAPVIEAANLDKPSEELVSRPSSVQTNPSPPQIQRNKRVKHLAPPRKSRGSTSQSVSSEFRFVDEEAQRYFTQVSSRMIVSERGYPILNFPSKLVKSLGLGWVQEVIKVLKLEKLVEGFPSSFRFNVSIVREFYANFPIVDDFELGVEIMIRGKMVKLSPAVIYNYFSLPAPLSHDEYDNFIDESSRYVMSDFSVLAFHDSELVLAHGDKPSRSHLTPSFRYLLHFIKTNLIPTGNAANVTLEAARLAILMYNRFPIPTGHLIYDSIVSKSRNFGKLEGSRGSVVFPCLVHYLCEEAGVDMMGPEDVFQAPTSPMTESFVRKSEKAVETSRKSKLNMGSVTEASLSATVEAAVQEATSKVLQTFGVKMYKKSKTSSSKATDQE